LIKNYYGICDCGKWGELPKDFENQEKFARCECGKLMYLTILINETPKDCGYRESNKIVNITLVKQ